MCSLRYKPGRHVHHLIPNIIRKPLAKPIQPTGTTHAAAQDAIDDKMHCADTRELDPLDGKRVVPVLVADERAQAGPGQIRPQPRPVPVIGDEKADVEVRAFVARAGERDIPETDGLGCVRAGEGGRVWVVGLPRRQGFVARWVAGWVGGVAVEEVDLLVQVGLLDQGRVVGQERPGDGCASVERAVEAWLVPGSVRLSLSLSLSRGQRPYIPAKCFSEMSFRAKATPATDRADREAANTRRYVVLWAWEAGLAAGTPILEGCQLDQSMSIAIRKRDKA